jgi:hypothetical protein
VAAAADFPPFTTVQNRFYVWRDSGLWTQIIFVLVMEARETMGREDLADTLAAFITLACIRLAIKRLTRT